MSDHQAEDQIHDHFHSFSPQNDFPMSTPPDDSFGNLFEFVSLPEIAMPSVSTGTGHNTQLMDMAGSSVEYNHAALGKDSDNSPATTDVVPLINGTTGDHNSDESNGKDSADIARTDVEYEPGNVQDAINCHSLVRETNETNNDTDENEISTKQSAETGTADENIIPTQVRQVVFDALPLELQQQQHEPDSTTDEETYLEIKKDPADGSGSSESDSEYANACGKRYSGGEECIRHGPGEKQVPRESEKEATAVPAGVEDVRDLLVMLTAEQNNLIKRQSNNSLKPGQATRLEELGQQIASLQRKIQCITTTKGASQSPASDKDGGKKSTIPEEQISAPSRRKPVATILSTAARKRKAAAQRIASLPRKRVKTSVPLMSRGKEKARAQERLKRKAPAQCTVPLARKKVKASSSGAFASRCKGTTAAQESTKRILDLLQNESIFAAGENMADMPVLDGFDATTARSQDRQFKELTSKLPEADQQEIRGDHAMLVKARNALKSRYKVLGEKYLVKSMKTPLYAYQFVATGWMVGRETSGKGPSGGILADSMGLGKTLETLACIAGNPPSEEDKKYGLQITLVIVPANAVDQWITEIGKHCNGIAVSHYKWSDSRNEVARQYSPIWITSYNELLQHYPSDNMVRKFMKKPDMTAADCEKYRPRCLGPLFHIRFYRLVLDEAHEIKNHTSRRMKACVELDAKYRWALSGTPIQNRVTEIFPYMCLLKAPHSLSLGVFRAHYLRNGKVVDDDGPLAMLLKETMLKRTMNTKFFGHALFELPRPHVLEPIMVDLSKEETLIYRRVEEILRQKVSKLFRRARKQNKKPKRGTWFTEVLRLRQAVLHPFLLESMMKDYFRPEDIKWLIDKLSEIQTRSPLIDQIGHWCEEQLKVCKNEQGSEAPKYEGLNASFDMIQQLKKVSEYNEWENNSVQELCRRCGFVPDDQFYPECGHVFCRSCMESYAITDTRVSAISGGCRPCNTLLANIRKSLPSIEESEIAEFGHWRGPSAKKSRGRGDDVNCIQPTAKNKSTFLEDSDRDADNLLTPSAKTLVLKSILLDWCKLYPDDKIIIFTLFVDGGRIVGRMLQDANIDFLYYFGSMSHAEKRKAVEDFKEKKEIRVLVASIQCTGQALNLASANRVIILDMWWNSAMEHQAFGRVYRMGQKKETYFGRILVRNSIDVRLAQLQLEKLQMVAKMIKDHDSSDMTLSIEEQAALLGHVVRDEEGNIIDIVADYDDEIDNTDANNANWNYGGGADEVRNALGECDQETMIEEN